ncbi:hypothetical protein L9F63_026273, partial [Diploptera punctata]
MAPLEFTIKEKSEDSAICWEVLGSVFWDAQGCILVEFLEPGQTINAARYIQTLVKLRRALHNKRPGRKIILQHDNARPHTAGATVEKIRTFGWETLPHPPYSPDLAPSDYHLFSSVKERGQRYETLEDIQKAVCQCLRAAGMDFYHKGIFKLVRAALE